MARIVRFHPPTNAHIIKRLRSICDNEGLKTDSKSLTTLVEVAEGDIRSCLNTLQVHRRNELKMYLKLSMILLWLQIIKSQTNVLDDKVIRSTALGLKDTSTSVTAVWDKLFKVPNRKRPKGIGEYPLDDPETSSSTDGGVDLYKTKWLKANT